MTEIEVQYFRERAASAAEACIAAGCPEHIRAFIIDGYDGEGVRVALGSMASLRLQPSSAQRPVPARTEADMRAELEAAAQRRFAQQAGRAA